MKETLLKMMRLARLRLPPQELERFASKANHVVEYIEKLKEVDTSGIEPTSHAIEVVNAFREDVVKPFEDHKKILKNAPKQFNNLFEVPKVIDET